MEIEMKAALGYKSMRENWLWRERSKRISVEGVKIRTR
jgi:hypothetical protein